MAPDGVANRAESAILAGSPRPAICKPRRRAAAFAVLFGISSGLSSIVTGTLPLALFGTDRYGLRLGWISSARLVTSALAPFIFAAISVSLSMAASVWFVALAGMTAVAAFGSLWWSFGRNATAVPVGRV